MKKAATLEELKKENLQLKKELGAVYKKNLELQQYYDGLLKESHKENMRICQYFKDMENVCKTALNAYGINYMKDKK